MCDPAVYYGWAEAELSMTLLCGRVSESFFSAYMEINPLEAGWRKRFEVLHLRELLSMVAHFGNRYNTMDRLREIASRFA